MDIQLIVEYCDVRERRKGVGLSLLSSGNGMYCVYAQLGVCVCVCVCVCVLSQGHCTIRAWEAETELIVSVRIRKIDLGRDIDNKRNISS
jgi:hypothetical protein